MEVDPPQINLSELTAELAKLLRAANEDDAKRLLTKVPQLLQTKDDSGRSVVHFAAVGGCVSIFQYALLTDPGAADKPDDLGWTPLMIAASAGRTELVRYLVGLAQVNILHQNKNGQTSLHYAASKNHREILKILLDAEADVNVADKYGATALHRAASQGHELIVRLLLSQPRIKIDARDSEGNTPLHLACDENREEVALMLVHRGAIADMKNKEEKTPWQLALNKNPELAVKLKRASQQV
ncbi:unnamed protein product [Caenorhabditis auriculariae]|uniref:26S proteasome non-ATPase regulatory subunit 10 n=1 Tax=Caenorhabditis auriculariae TaxID=2777116 RepID=A0A8S1HQR7_9PELO|nr:unnamed protein product [Caenorhabditis auriculariae]